jgi:hypothetical protein
MQTVIEFFYDKSYKFWGGVYMILFFDIFIVVITC